MEGLRKDTNQHELAFLLEVLLFIGNRAWICFEGPGAILLIFLPNLITLKFKVYLTKKETRYNTGDQLRKCPFCIDGCFR